MDGSNAWKTPQSSAFCNARNEVAADSVDYWREVAAAVPAAVTYHQYS